MKLIITDMEDFDIPVEGEYKVIKANGDIHHCIGCFGCWVKTPGKCVIFDGYEEIGGNIGKCEELILVSRCYYGSVSPFVKMALDRALSYIHPDFVIRKGEMHVTVAFPRFLYKMAAEFGWRQMIKKNGGKTRDLRKTLE